MARAKRLARCSQHHRTHRFILRNTGKRCLQCRQHLVAQRVKARWVVQGQGHYAARIHGVQQNGGIVHRSSWSQIGQNADMGFNTGRQRRHDVAAFQA